MQSLKDYRPIEAAPPGEPCELAELDMYVTDGIEWLLELGRYEPLHIVESLIRSYQLKVKLVSTEDDNLTN
jgi:hypothetical protein